MAINMQVGSPSVDDFAVAPEAAPVVKKKPQATIELKMRKTLDGDFIIYDHEDVDIVVSSKNLKVTTFPKPDSDEGCYHSQMRLFEFLQKRGTIERDTVQAGSVYNAIEGKIIESTTEGVSSTQVVLLTISEFLEVERPFFARKEDFEEMEVDKLTEPTDEDSTALGEVPHAEEKGSMRPGLYYHPFLNTYNYFY